MESIVAIVAQLQASIEAQVQTSLTTMVSSKSLQTLNLSNISAVVPIKLDRTNYLVWKTLIVPVLEHQGLLQIVNGEKPCPSQFVQTESVALPTLNQEYLGWIQRDKHAMIIINGTISESILPYIVGLKSSKDLWMTLQKRFSSISASHVI